MAYKIKLSLHGSRPAVNRTIILDQDMKLYNAALVFITAMGWRGGRSHSFVTNLDTEEEAQIEREMEESYTIEDLKDMNATFYYDRYTDWRLDIDFKGETDENGPSVLSYKGECPNQLLSGVRDFNRIRRAARDPSDPYHDRAEAWLGTVPPYDIEEVNRRLGAGETALPEYYFITKNQPKNPLIAFMNAAWMIIERNSVNTLEFRCPECGAVCDGRRNLDLPPSMIRSRDEYPATIVCPECGTVTDLSVKNDGFRIGYHEKNSSKPQDQQTALYDAISHRRGVRDPFEEARYQAELGILYVRYEYNLDNSEIIEKCRAELDEDDPRYAETETLCRLSIVRQAINRGEDVPEDVTGFTGVQGAIAIVNMHRLMDRSKAEIAVMIPEVIGMVESDTDADLTDRCTAAMYIASAAQHIEDVDALIWTASVLKEAASEAEECANSLESAGWRSLCSLMEEVVCGLYKTGMLKEADAALKCMTGPFLDCVDEDVPLAVRNLVAFRRGMLFLSAGWDREQALEDLDTIMTCCKGYKENGIFTTRRVPYVAMLRAHFGATKGDLLANERTLSANILTQLCSTGFADETDMSYAIRDFVRTYVGKGYSCNRVRDEFKKQGLMINDRLDDFGKFDIAEMWENRLTWSV